MPISYSIDPDRKIVREVWQGWISVHDVRRHLADLFADPLADACRRSLIHSRNVKNLFTTDELWQLIRNEVLPMLSGRGWSTAVLTDDLGNFEFVRQYETSKDLFFRVKVFTDETTATEWLRAQ